MIPPCGDVWHVQQQSKEKKQKKNKKIMQKQANGRLFDFLSFFLLNLCEL